MCLKYVPMPSLQDLPGSGGPSLASVAPWKKLPRSPLNSEQDLTGIRAWEATLQACPYSEPGDPALLPETQVLTLPPLSGPQDNGLGWDLADPAYLVINIYQALGARACSWLGRGVRGRCFRRISKPFPNEGAMRGVCHLGLGILGEGRTDGQRNGVRGSLGGLGHAPAARPPHAPQECGGGVKRPRPGETWQPLPWTVLSECS